MLDLSALLTIATAFFAAAASPGPATLAVASVSMSAGRRRGFVFGLGLSAGLAFWGLIAATGLGAMLQSSAYLLTLLKVLGGLYLLWLAFTTARAAADLPPADTTPLGAGDDFRRGLLLNISNPKAVFAWMAVLALGLGQNSGTAQVAFATGSCMFLGLVIYAAYAFIFSTAGAMGIYRRSRKWIDRVVAGLFALAGFSLLRSAFART